jgi:hypothetical protein
MASPENKTTSITTIQTKLGAFATGRGMEAPAFFVPSKLLSFREDLF